MATNPTLEQAIADFKAVQIPNFYAGDPGEPEFYTVEQIAADGNLAEGYCADVSDAFVAFLAGQGIEAITVETSSAQLGYRNWRGDMVHFVVEVEGLIIDWTYKQFGVSHEPAAGDPLVQEV
jgi:transglutaminase-like putative cysteine protease